ncbi:ABC transporter ATP-binding protein [Paracraurococcus lichenis]|uniref:ABC transporter ATP-binding protein n=1 Tax=Paracraurococcus lichenis TaxID=3064888 RepID=A0ABT9DY42_9PROT|nr:ABC transporter ATP-binding protein [Paracraurococcus sp. LOR1-02]MDO9708827.1 ABC transporter ATP-binding protein [Paracraurococcus sp. LOR1-02]
MTVALEGIGLSAGGQPVLHPVTMALEPGLPNVLLGPTGAGKTTLLRLLAGLDRPSEGRLVAEGRDVTGLAVRKRSVAMVYQQFINYPSFTVFENIAAPLRVARLPKAEIAQRVQDAATLLRLTPYLQRRPLELSGGQQQRTAIARALVKRAALVLMDEPLANLDYKLREELREELPKLFAESGSVFVYATTEPAEALLLGGRVATLSEGRVTQFGMAGEVFRRPADLATARVFSDPPLNEAPARLEGGRLVLSTGAVLPLPVGGLAEGPCTIGIRAHQLSLEPLPGAVALPAEVRVSEVTGSESYVHLDVGGLNWVVLAPGVRRPEPHEAATVWLDPQRCLVFGADGRLAAVAALAEAA